MWSLEKARQAKEERMEKLADQITIARRVLPGAVQALDAREMKTEIYTYIDVDFDADYNGRKRDARVTLVFSDGDLIAAVVNIHRATSLSVVRVKDGMWQGVTSTMYEEEKIFERPTFKEAAEELKKLMAMFY